MSDVRWYYDQPPAQYDVSTFHPYSTPPVYRKGGWNFDVSPTDLFSLGKYAFSGLGKLKDWLFGGTAPTYAGLADAAGAIGPEAAAMATPGVAPSSLDSMLAATGYNPGAMTAVPGATSAALAELYPGLQSAAGAISPSAAALATPGVAPASLDTMLASSGLAQPATTGLFGGAMGGLESAAAGGSVPTMSAATGAGAGAAGTGAADLSGSIFGAAGAGPMIAAAALPAAFYAMKELFGKEYDPMAAIESQFGTKSPGSTQVLDYLNNPDARKVPVMDTLEGLSKLGYNRQALSTLGDAGFWDVSQGRWSNKSMPWTVHREGGREYDYSGAPPEGYSTWDAYNDYAKQLEDLGIVGRSRRKRRVTNPWQMLGEIGY